MRRPVPLLVLGSLLAATHAAAQDHGSPARGSTLAQRLCAECHSIVRGETRSPHPDAPSFGRIAAVPGMTSIALTVALRTSHESMPNLVLQSDELQDVIAYILSLK